MLAQYDQAMKVLSTALASKEVSVVLRSRADLDLIKLRARQLRDRTLLADATEFQMKVERWLGQLLIEGKKAGQVAEGRRGKGEKFDPNRVTLDDLGVDRKLSSRAQRAAALKEDAFAAVVSETRAKIMSGGARPLNPYVGERRAAAEEPASPFEHHLLDGTRLGNVRLGKLKARIDALDAERKLLQAIHDHVGAGYDALATVASAVNEHTLEEIIYGAE